MKGKFMKNIKHEQDKRKHKVSILSKENSNKERIVAYQMWSGKHKEQKKCKSSLCRHVYDRIRTYYKMKKKTNKMKSVEENLQNKLRQYQSVFIRSQKPLVIPTKGVKELLTNY